jgi:intracellular sulfur oxidation DsrE/DsrF family protein
MKCLLTLLACWTLCCNFTLAAEDAPQRLTPAIEGYGGAVYLPDAAAQLDPAKEYKLVFDITQRGADDSTPLPGLDTAARFINLAALAEVPKEKLHIVMVLHGPGTSHALSGERYKERFAADNPSLELINKLVAYGAQVYVCGQALAGFGFAHTEVNANIEVAAAALTVLANYQLDGYALMSY